MAACWTRPWLVVGAVALSIACGQTARDRKTSAGPSPTEGGSGGNSGDGGVPGAGGTEPTPPDEEPGSVGMRRLSRREYVRTVFDLLGVEADPPALEDYQPSDSAPANIIEAALDSATAVTRAVFIDPSRAAEFACDDASVERDCAEALIASFGARAFRRPLRAEESEAFLALYDEMADSGASHLEGMEQVVRAMLSSIQFLFRIEHVPDADSVEPYQLDPYAMASRLSYFLWGTMPDSDLFAAAERGELDDEASLIESFDTMAGSERMLGLGQGLSQRWLELPELTSAGPAGVAAAAMQAEVPSFLTLFFSDNIALSELFSTDVNFVDTWLVQRYGFDGGEGRVSVTTDQRYGLLGLGALLVSTSLEDRTSPSRRGAFIVDKFLCSPVPAPPPGDDFTLQHEYPQSLRQSLEATVAEPSCRGCHATFDPYGLALEQFDHQGRYTETDYYGQPVDVAVTLPGGSTGSGLAVLATLGQDPSFARCASLEIAEHAVGRSFDDADDPLLSELATSVGDGASLRDVARSLIESAAFRWRRPAAD